ncbi:MAG: hypothetical protein JXA33_17135 [Anaerolineae bacterium]|nr:hypothetical protein [Anaerolineae bacterium]
MARLLDIPALDPDDARRRKLLNILLLIIAPFTILILSFALYLDASGTGTPLGIRTLYLASVSTLVGIVLIFLINRYWLGWLASLIFLLLITFAIFLNIEPQLLVKEFLFLFTIPILMASVILRSWSSFAMASLISFLIIQTELKLKNIISLPAILGFFTIAVVSWLSSRTLESALQDLRTINRELDQRVADRTRQLATANTQLANTNVELANANQQLEVAYEQLKELDRLKSRFVSTISHELRTPLSAIHGFAEMVNMGVYGPVTEKQQNALKRIMTNDQKLLSLVNDLLDQARMEAGQLSLHNELFTLPDLIHDVESTIHVLAENKGLYLKVEIDENVPQALLGDSKRLHQIIVNLANNALKFTEQGGITLHFYHSNPDTWGFAVIDTGTGIPAEAQKYIFDPFRQIDSSATREHTGFGLGLAIVKQLVTLMEGEVRLDSSLGQGSTFSVVLPLLPPNHKEETA